MGNSSSTMKTDISEKLLGSLLRATACEDTAQERMFANSDPPVMAGRQ